MNLPDDDVQTSGRVLGIDLGSRRIGVAVTDSAQRVATGVMALPRSGNLASDHRALARLVGEYEAVGVVVGLPFSLSGALGPAARAVLDELDQIRRTVGVSVASVDERFTTRTAATALRASGRRDRDQRAVIDQSAAAVLLQSWVDGRPKADQ